MNRYRITLEIDVDAPNADTAKRTAVMEAQAGSGNIRYYGIELLEQDVHGARKICPTCGEGCPFTEQLGEDGPWLVCKGCGARTDEAELQAANQEES